MFFFLYMFFFSLLYLLILGVTHLLLCIFGGSHSYHPSLNSNFSTFVHLHYMGDVEIIINNNINNSNNNCIIINSTNNMNNNNMFFSYSSFPLGTKLVVYRRHLFYLYFSSKEVTRKFQFWKDKLVFSVLDKKKFRMKKIAIQWLVYRSTLRLLNHSKYILAIGRDAPCLPCYIPLL